MSETRTPDDSRLSRRLLSTACSAVCSAVWRQLPQFLADIGAWIVAFALTYLLRFEMDVTTISWRGILWLTGIAACLQFGTGWVTSLYRGRFRGASFEEARVLAIDVGLVGLGLMTVLASMRLSIGPVAGVAFATPLALLIMLAVRYLRRGIRERRRFHSNHGQPTLIYGAGEAAAVLIKSMFRGDEQQYRPVGLLDDDPAKRHFQLNQLRVLGTFDDLARAAQATRAKVLIVAISAADAEMMRDVQLAADALDLKVKVMPPLSELLEGRLRTGDLRDISIEDLLGRAPHDTGVEAIAGYLGGCRVLVTGAGGSIGSELCVQIAKFEPRELIMLDRDETGLQETLLRVAGNGLLDTNEVVLADIRDGDTLRQIFADRRPDIVFHAAALKHLPMLEQYPDEAWKTNVLGTLNVLAAARNANVGTFINISTDKAANPTSVLGHSKRLAEKLTGWYGEQTHQRYLSVRFGNVIGSRGSMLPTFRRLIEQGGPLTVTHPEVTRYFMTIPEACQLVIQAGGIGSTGEVLILDMGQPVKILEIAERMISMSGKDIEIVVTGLRPGEKLHEDLFEVGEPSVSPFHRKIAHGQAGQLRPADLRHELWMQYRGHVSGMERPAPTGALVAKSRFTTNEERSE